MRKESSPLPLPPEQILADYRIAYQSRQASIIGRREVLNGKAKFGIFGDGKELAQIAIARFFRKGDWRSGYYRDQTWMMALGSATVQQLFAELYADSDPAHEPHTGGRSMNAHFSSHYIAPDGTWRNQLEMYNTGADISPTAGQVPRAVGLAYASVLYRHLPPLPNDQLFSHQGDEVTWVSIGNGATAEGIFWESVNAIGVLKAPAVIAIYDDGYGISVPNELQMVKADIGAALKGFERDHSLPPGEGTGYDLYAVPGWDYPALCKTFAQAAENARKYHVPALVHVTECTQPLGHSTSGSHERYKPAARLAWEDEHDCLHTMRAWILSEGLIGEAELEQQEAQDLQAVESARKAAWDDLEQPILAERRELLGLLDQLTPLENNLQPMRDELAALPHLRRRDLHIAAHRALRTLRHHPQPALQKLQAWIQTSDRTNEQRFSSFLYCGTALQVSEVKPTYAPDAPVLMGFEILNACFDAAFARYPRLVAFGEDVGVLGDVNQGMRGMQSKYGPLRVSDTGIRETTIIGQAIGLSMRGFRPIAEVQYLDYVPYAMQTLADDLANLHWRTIGGQKAPIILRTRGHRLEGIWHSGSPMSGLMNLLRGIYFLVPRDMTRAAGFYNTLLQADEPAILVETLNSYRLRDPLPSNIGEFTIPLGVPETLRVGSDLTIVTYGPNCRIALEAAKALEKVGIQVEVIDVQTLMPFDLGGKIVESLQKTSRILFLDEDVPGGATAYMMQEVLEKQAGYTWLDSPPRTLSARPHRPAYGDDGDYWSKPSMESVFDTVYEIMHEANPRKYPAFN